MAKKTSSKKTAAKTAAKKTAAKKTAAKKTAAKKTAASGAPATVDEFVAGLSGAVDASRFAKALKMLRAERFQLFSKVDDGQVVGVVRSQTDSSLFYACRLGSDGTFACCTQNLNHCGGLRGKPCKHLLLLLIGLARGGAFAPAAVWPWVEASKARRPVLDKDAMADVFLQHAQPEAVDWRPLETVPEDFLAY